MPASRKRYVSNKPTRNPFAPPDPNAPPPPPPSAPEPEPEKHGSKAPVPPGGPKGGPTPPSMEDLKEASGATFRFGALLILSLLASQLPLPYTLAAPVLIVASIAFGVIALRRSWAISTRNLMTPMLIAGIAMALMMSVTVATKFALWPVEVAHQECTQYALTNTAKAECEADYQQAVTERLDSLRGVGSTE